MAFVSVVKGETLRLEIIACVCVVRVMSGVYLDVCDWMLEVTYPNFSKKYLDFLHPLKSEGDVSTVYKVVLTSSRTLHMCVCLCKVYYLTTLSTAQNIASV